MKRIYNILFLICFAIPFVAQSQNGPSVRISWRQLPVGTNGQMAIVGVDGNGTWVTPPFLKLSDTTQMLASYLAAINSLNANKADKSTTISINGTVYNLSQNRSWIITKSDVGLGNVDNTADMNKPVSNATQSALNAKEDIANKSTSINLGTSNTLYPTQNAVKTYVDNSITNINTNMSSYLPKSGGTMTGDINLANDPTQPLHPVTLQYFQDKLSGLSWKPSVAAASTTNINIANPGFTSLDTVTLTNNARILLKNQTNEAENGIYIWQGQSNTLARVADMNSWAEVVGAAVFVENGASNGKSGWTVGGVPKTGTINTTDITFSQFTGGGQLSVTTPITISGNTIGHANSGVSAGTYKIVTVDNKGHVTGGTNPTTISGFGITDAYTKSELQNSGQSQIHWDNITDKPTQASVSYDSQEFTGTVTNTFLLSNNINQNFLGEVMVYLNGVLQHDSDYSIGTNSITTTYNSEVSDVIKIFYPY